MAGSRKALLPNCFRAFDAKRNHQYLSTVAPTPLERAGCHIEVTKSPSLIKREMPRLSIAASAGRLDVFLFVVVLRPAKDSAQNATDAATGIVPSIVTVVVVTAILSITSVIALHKAIAKLLR